MKTEEKLQEYHGNRKLCPFNRWVDGGSGGGVSLGEVVSFALNSRIE